jgi:GDP-L-fucose synthase
MDLMSADSTNEYIKLHRPTKILHLAGLCGGILYNKQNPAILLRNNSTMALNLFEAAREYGVSEIITIGSTCQYPAKLPPPFKAEDMWNGYPEESNGAYGIAKRFICELGQAYMAQYGIKHKHLILANLYGPGDEFNSKDSHVIPSLINKFLTYDCVEVWGDPAVKREFLYVEDAAMLIKKAMLTDNTGIINIGSGEEVTIERLSGLISKIIKYKNDIVFNSSMPSGQKHRLLDSKYKGKTTLKSGLVKTIAWCRGEVNPYR